MEKKKLKLKKARDGAAHTPRSNVEKNGYKVMPFAKRMKRKQKRESNRSRQLPGNLLFKSCNWERSR
jgi:hypothetical protein